jgi:hypothetical protein
MNRRRAWLDLNHGYGFAVAVFQAMSGGSRSATRAAFYLHPEAVLVLAEVSLSWRRQMASERREPVFPRGVEFMRHEDYFVLQAVLPLC